MKFATVFTMVLAVVFGAVSSGMFVLFKAHIIQENNAMAQENLQSLVQENLNFESSSALSFFRRIPILGSSIPRKQSFEELLGSEDGLQEESLNWKSFLPGISSYMKASQDYQRTFSACQAVAKHVTDLKKALSAPVLRPFFAGQIEQTEDIKLENPSETHNVFVLLVVLFLECALSCWFVLRLIMKLGKGKKTIKEQELSVVVLPEGEGNTDNSNIEKVEPEIQDTLHELPNKKAPVKNNKNKNKKPKIKRNKNETEVNNETVVKRECASIEMTTNPFSLMETLNDDGEVSDMNQFNEIVKSLKGGKKTVEEPEVKQTQTQTNDKIKVEDDKEIEVWVNVSCEVLASLRGMKSILPKKYNVTMDSGLRNSQVKLTGTQKKISEFIVNIKSLTSVSLEGVSAKYNSILVGSQGERLKQLEAKYDVTIRVPKKSDNQPKPIAIFGIKANVLKAEKTVRNILIKEEEKENKREEEKRKISNGEIIIKKLNVDRKYFGTIIGNNGDNLKKMTRGTEVNVNFNKEKNTITVKGSPSEVPEVETKILDTVEMKKITEQPKHEFRLVPKHRNLVLSNNDLKEIQTYYKVKVTIPPRENLKEILTIQGLRENAELAYEDLTAKLPAGEYDLTIKP